MPSLPSKSPLFDTILIVGVGLIGGSVARGVRSRNIARRIIGAGRNRASLEAAQAAGVIDDFALTPHDVTTLPAPPPGGIDFLLVCTPVDRVVEDVRRWHAVVGSHGVITDAGSTKRAICEELNTFPPTSGDTAITSKGPPFIGSHPLAGSEKQGWQNSDGSLFEGRRCIVTPDSHASAASVHAVTTFWKSLGMTTELMAPALHDQLLAVTSHLPHVTAAALAMMLTDETTRLAATGFRSTARVADGDPSVWTPIFLENAEAVLAAMEQFQSSLSRLADAVRSRDQDAITAYLTEARDRYQQLDTGE